MGTGSFGFSFLTSQTPAYVGDNGDQYWYTWKDFSYYKLTNPSLSFNYPQFEVIPASIQSPSNNVIIYNMPTGAIMPYVVGASSPTIDGWLPCNGYAVYRNQYPILFQFIGTIYGEGDGTTTFNLPNFSGMFLRGMGVQTINNITYSSSGNIASPQSDGIANHSHDINLPSSITYVNNNQSGSCIYAAGTSSYFSNRSTTNFPSTTLTQTGNTGLTETRPINYGVYYFIKT